MQAVINETISGGFQCIISEISHKPIMNKASVKFHKKHGFILENYLKKEGIKLGVYRLDL